MEGKKIDSEFYGQLYWIEYLNMFQNKQIGKLAYESRERKRK